MGDAPLAVVLRADEGIHEDGSAFGGKASAVARLIEAGHPVPRSAVVTTAAYRAAAATPGAAAVLRRVRDPDGDPIDDEAIDRAFLDAPLPADVSTALAHVAATFEGRVAVRSSATSEDLSSAAFAGQYRSFLDVEPAELDRAVRLVWASLWHAAPRAYRRLRDIDDEELAMAVLVMEMIDPVVAGVMFTRDPVGDESRLRIETVAGSAEALVSGAATPDAFIWPRIEAADAAAARLGPAFGELVERGLAIESDWATALDIEFAVDRSGGLWLVQARPVTTLRERRPDPSRRLTRAGIAEMLPGVLPPLLRATAGDHVDQGFRVVLDHLRADLGSSLGDHDRFVRFVGGRAMLDLAPLRRAAATVPGGSVAALDRGYEPGRPAEAATTASASVVQVARVMRHRRLAVVESEIVIQAVGQLLADDGRRDDERIEDLLARWERVVDLGARATAAEMVVAALATAAHEGVERALSRRLGPARGRELAQRLTARRSVPTGPLHHCVRGEVPALRGVDWRATTWATASAMLTEDPEGRAFLARWYEGLGRSGSRSVFGGPTWEDDPELAWLSFVAGHTRPAPPPAQGLASIDLPTWRRFVRREAADAAELLDRRERTKMALLDLGGIAHRLTLAIAAHLVEVRVLADPADVWLLTPSEIRVACSTGHAPTDLADRRDALARDLASETSGSPPIGGNRGWPASSGRASGRPVVVTAPRAGAIERGDVLVARNTDAEWAPLFALAGAIVVEEGGPLSHAAIVARELGVPAVVNLPGIVERVRAAGPHAIIHVDGSTGEVTVVTADPIPLLAPVPEPPRDEPRLGVFVTGLVGASALFGVVVSITQAVSSTRGIGRTRDVAAIPAVVVAEVVRHGTSAARHATGGLATRRRYGQIAVASIVLAVLLGTLSTAEYVASRTTTRIVWLLVGLSGVLAAGAAANVARIARQHWPDVPPVVRRLTPGPRHHATSRQVWYAMPSFHRRWMMVLAATAVVLLGLNLVAPAVLSAVDEPIYDAIGAPDPDPWGPTWFGMYFGRPQVVIPAALLVALFTMRCRLLALAYPLTIAFGGILNLGLGVLVDKHRPPLGAHADQTDSFPSGHAIEVTLLLGLAPLAVAVLLRSPRVGTLARWVASGVLGVMLIDGLREGSHWPTDHLGGFAIAMCAVVCVHALARVPALHRGCTRCPAMALLHADGTTESGSAP